MITMMICVGENAVLSYKIHNIMYVENYILFKN